MIRHKFKIIFFVSVFFTIVNLFNTLLAETIILKNGQVVEADIVQQNDNAIVVNINGIDIRYYLDEIDEIKSIETISVEDLIASVSPEPVSPKDIFSSNSPAIVCIYYKPKFGLASYGSGFVFDSQGIIITNYHVVFPNQYKRSNPRDITVSLINGETYPLEKIIFYDQNLDICVLKINEVDLPVIGFADSDRVEIGEVVYTIGSPLGLDYTFSDGLLSGIRSDRDIKWLQFTAPASPGNSGGPLLNNRGEAIGVITMQYTEGQNLNFALPINIVNELIDTYYKVATGEFDSPVEGEAFFLAQGDQAIVSNDNKLAIEHYEKALQINPDADTTYIKLAEAYSRGYASISELKKSIDLLKDASFINPDNYIIYNKMGYYYYRLGYRAKSDNYYDKAISYLKKATRLNSQDANSYQVMGKTYIDLGDYDKAERYLKKSLKLYRQQRGYGSIYAINSDLRKIFWMRWRFILLFLIVGLIIAFIKFPKFRFVGLIIIGAPVGLAIALVALFFLWPILVPLGIVFLVLFLNKKSSKNKVPSVKKTEIQRQESDSDSASHIESEHSKNGSSQKFVKKNDQESKEA